ncbi:MAG: hypothetical protein LC115_10775 [Bacteroidia bacterium]|nr:hypothetical protein [Bacteroidia bacterium]
MAAINVGKLDQLQNTLKILCEACGAQMVYSAKEGKLVCGHCGNEKIVETTQHKVVERSFSEALNFSSSEMDFGIAQKNFTCKGCGSVTAVDVTTVAFYCKFCGSHQVNEEAQEHRVIRPFGILPFSITKDRAATAFKEWIGTGWFHPNDLQHLAQAEKISGVYIPFWTYDAQTESSWTALAGYYYYETITTTDANGNKVQQQVQKIRWVPASGYFDHFFDDVTVIASKGITQARVQNIYPFDLKKVVDYDPKFITGWESELYSVDVKQGFERAEKIMNDYIYQQCATQVPGDTHKDLNVQTHKHSITFKHILLPIYVSAYRYNDKVFQVVVNGQTGKITGEKPLSWIKITITVIFVIILAIIVYFLFFKKH